MRKHFLWVLLVLIAGGAGFLASRAQATPPAPQNLSARCTINVPAEWGDYVGSGAYGLAFRDSSGTLRIINKFPCGLDGAPHVALEVHRK